MTTSGKKTPSVWVLPARNAAGLAAVIAAMWYAGASQNNGAAYMLSFLLAGVSLTSVLHAWLNLHGVEVSLDRIAPVFEGEEAAAPITLRGRRGRTHRSVLVTVKGVSEGAVADEVEDGAAPRTHLYFPAKARGLFPFVEVRLISRYPFGFFAARARQVISQPYYVYPKPEGDVPFPAPAARRRERQEGAQQEGDDFAGVRTWRSGESMRHVDWKAVARGQPLLVKQWAGIAGDTLIFAWDDLPGLELESKLRQLARWIVTAEKREISYGLRLPGQEIAPARGEPHLHRCLQALAAYPAT